MMKNNKQTSSSQLKFAFNTYEKTPVAIWATAQVASVQIASEIAEAILNKQKAGQHLVLGLATGSTPVNVYQELVRLHKEENLDFSNVITFNLDEYFPMQPDAPQSYVHFMKQHLFNHVNIPEENINIPDGTIDFDEVKPYCQAYEDKIQSLGGIDIQLLGIGRTGHIGFNEPGSRESSVTRLVRLDEVTKRDAMSDFVTIENVPRRAITMGIQTILRCKKIYIMAWGMHKSEVVKQAVEGPITTNVAASFLQNHANAKFYLDIEAASSLTSVYAPWLVGMCDWTEDLMCRGVIWLSKRLKKPILKLTNADYNENGLSELTDIYGSAYTVNLIIFNRLQHTITGWPGGKANADDTTRPERALPAKKRVIIFSPHPDDDVISMGGTFSRLVEQGHEVHVAYQTSGNVAVHDHDATRFLEFFEEFGTEFGLLNKKAQQEISDAKQFLKSKGNIRKDNMVIRNAKGIIRRGEARAGARYLGLPEEQIHFLNMPFYETGLVKKNEISQEDVDVIKFLLDEVKPQQVYAAGDLADPHGTHRVCLDAIVCALQQLKSEDWIKDCWLWLYRGAWHEFPIEEIQMAVPISPEELMKKRQAIFMHQSQKDSPPFPGDDNREFWQRSEDRNRETAQLYRDLGFASYEAMEAFRRMIF